MGVTKQWNIFSDITHVPAVLNQKVYPSLNGIRALSVLGVVISHMTTHYQFLKGMLFMGYLGVNTFFVLSGFLITSLCIREKVVSKDISLKNFYIRRALRILPVAYLYILVVVILSAIFNLGVSKLNVLSSALFAANFNYFHKAHFDPDLGHFWTLAVEEQFYLMFPILLKKNFKVFVSFILFILFVVPVIIYLQDSNLLYEEGLAYALPHYLIKFQAISAGCLLSVLCFKGHLDLGKWKPYISGILIIIILIVKYDRFTYTTAAIWNNLFISAMTGLVIVNSIYKSSDLLFKFLNFKLIALIGVLSYSIYIWQQLFVSGDGIFPISVYPYNVLFLVTIPCLSYYFYEKPFLNLKSRFVKVK